MLYLGCIADDFTGAGDAASFIRKSGLKTVYLNGDKLSDYTPAADVEALVIALKCRSIPAREAVAQVCEAANWLLKQGAQQLYYKYCSTFDSTSEGNIGPVTDALMELCGADCTVLCPALPVNGRTVRGGILYVNGVPLADSPMRFHPLNPMTESEVTRLMEMQSRYPSYAVTLEELYGDETAMLKHLEALKAKSERCTLAVDYCEDRDGEQIVRLFGKLPLLTGGSGLLEHLGRRWRQAAGGGEAAEAAPLSGGARLLLAGSCSEMTRRQVRCFVENGGRAIKLEPLQLLDGTQTVEALCGELAAAKGDIMFYSSDDADQVQRNQQQGAELVSGVLEDSMGRLAAFAVEQGCDRVVVAGGETSGRVMLALGYDAYEILEDVAPGVPRMVPVEKPELSLALKSGNFGGEDFFLTALN